MPNTETRPDGTVVRVDYVIECTECHSTRSGLLIDRKITGWSQGEIYFGPDGVDERSWERTGDDDYEYGEFEEHYTCSNCDQEYTAEEVRALITRRESVILTPEQARNQPIARTPRQRFELVYRDMHLGENLSDEDVRKELAARPWLNWFGPPTAQQLRSLTKKQRELYEQEKPDGEEGRLINAPDMEMDALAQHGIECTNCHTVVAIDTRVRFRERNDSLIATEDLCPNCGNALPLPTNKR